MLRSLTRDDARAIIANDREATAWAPDFPTAGDVNVATLALAGGLSFATDTMPWGLFTIVDQSSGLAIGGVGFKHSPNSFGEVEIGYGIADSHQNRGVATEAVAALRDLAHRLDVVVIADTDRENVASQRVLEKCGFQKAGETDTTFLWRNEGDEGASRA